VSEDEVDRLQPFLDVVLVPIDLVGGKPLLDDHLGDKSRRRAVVGGVDLVGAQQALVDQEVHVLPALEIEDRDARISDVLK
jgi:hypothetical protein